MSRESYRVVSGLEMAYIKFYTGFVIRVLD